MLNKEQYFPTNVYVKDILDGQLLRDLKKYILDRSGKEEGFKRSNVKGWHSPDMTEKKEYYFLYCSPASQCYSDALHLYLHGAFKY